MSRFVDGAARERAITEPQNVVVTAGAGTGKTSVLVERALYLVLSGHKGIERLAAITFTEKAAAELKRRLAEALTETLARLDGHPPSEYREAERTLERLRRAGHGDAILAERALAALESLDAAFIGTLHALAADILRRHAMAAHLPPDFAVEDELSGGLLFEEAWTGFLAEELGPHGTRGELWARVLRRLRESDIEHAAGSLHANPAAADLLAVLGYGPLIPDAELDLQVRELLHRILEYLEQMRRVPPPKRNKNFPVFLELERDLLQAYLSGGPDALDSVDVSSVDDFWERKEAFKAGTPNADDMQETAKHALKLLGRLRKVDEGLVRDLMELLRPFALRIREHVRREGVLTFDDLLILARDLLRDVPSVRKQERERFAAILVDEFQDTDPIQYDIVFFLCGVDKPEERNPQLLPLEADRLFIVGDPKQSIYRFRGADMSAYDRAVTHVLKHGTGISLSTSYRSRPEVLGPLNALFRGWIGAIQNPSIEPDYEDITASRDRGGHAPGVEIWSILTPEDAPVDTRRKAEAQEIAGRLGEWLSEKTCRPRDIALLFRALTDAPIYMRALREAGIEFVLEGGRAFFERPEIVEAFALLEAVANPADPVALIGVLRSGFGGASDQELVQHAEQGEPWRWTSDGGTGTVHETFARLRELDAKRRTLPLDRWIQWVLVESAFALTQIAHLDGPQRLANLRKLATKAGTLVRDRGLTLSETLRVLEDAFAGERVEGESPLADESLDVVRLTTIHKAKGLEFGIVIVPDLARRAQEPPSGTRVSRFTYQGDTYLAVEVADRERTRNLAEVFRAEDQRTHDEAEAKRLLYVATTRARDRVILVNSATSSRVAWMNGLAQVGYVLTNKTFPPTGWLGESGVWHRVCDEQDATPPPAPRELSLATDAYRSFQHAAALAARPGPPRFRNPSHDHLLAATDKDASEDAGILPYAPDLARAVGVAVHRVLETWDFGDGDAWKQSLPPIAERTARELGISPREEVEREASSILAAFASSALRTYLEGVDILGREVPILWRDPEGATVIGYADLIYRASGNVHVVDYKTDADARPAHAALYRPQLADYARAVERALGLDAPAITEVMFVRAGTRVVL